MERSVANLTTEQLYRKRAFDRENQRASRARKKTRIAELEDEVSGLKHQLELSELQLKHYQKMEATLRDVIGSARESLEMVDSSERTNLVVPSPPSSSGVSRYTDEEFEGAGFENASRPISFTFPENRDAIIETKGYSSGAHPELGPERVHNDDIEGRNALIFDLPSTPDFDNMSHFWENFFPTYLTPTPPFTLPFFNPISPDLPSNLWTSPLETPPPTHTQPVWLWERLPRHLDPSCRLDTVLAELFRSSRQQAAKIPEFSEPAFPSIDSLLNPETKSDKNPISNAIGQHGRVTMGHRSLELKIAIMYNMCVYLRWLITPTKQNYNAMPSYLRPLEIQLTIPHPDWIDIIVWPEARERIIRHMDWSEFEILRAISNYDMSINWPHGLSTVFTATEDSSEMRMSGRFEAHIRSLENWTMGGEVTNRFPFLKGVASKEMGNM